MSLNLSYRTRTCDTCNGNGLANPPHDADGNEILCASCDGAGKIETRRPIMEIVQAHLEAAERLFDQAAGDGDSAYFRTRASHHTNLANLYVATAQAEQLKRIADALHADGFGLADICDYLANRDMGKDTDAEAEARTDYAHPFN